MNKSKFIELARKSYDEHEERVRLAVFEIDEIAQYLDKLRADLDAWVAQKPRVTIHPSLSEDANVTIHIKIGSGTYPVPSRKSTFSNVREEIKSFFEQTVFRKIVSAYNDAAECGLNVHDSIPPDVIWERISKDRLLTACLSSVNLLTEEDFDNTERRMKRGRSVLLSRIKKAMNEEYAFLEGLDRETLIRTLKNPKNDSLYNAIMNPWQTVNTWKRKKQYKDVDYDLTDADIEQLVDDFIVKQTMNV